MTSPRLSVLCLASVFSLASACHHESPAGGEDAGGGGDLGVGPDFADPNFVDDDNDTIANSLDNCPGIANIDQADWDNDGVGDPCDPDPPPTTCGDDKPMFQRETPNVFIILDRSLSMGMGSAPTKWTQANTALDQVATNLADKIRVGMSVFPGTGGGGNCGAPTNVLPMGQHTTAQIQAAYAAPLAPGGYTPMRKAFADTRANSWFGDASDPQNESRVKSILFITDGVPNCAVGHEGDINYSDQLAVVGEVDQITALGVKTYVVGFGSGVDATNLNEIAQHGGTDNPNDAANRYYQANNGAELEQALLSIGNELISCDLYITGKPADPTRIYVDQAGKHLTRDAADGFTYDPNSNSIKLTGKACDDLKASVGTQAVTITFGCPADGSAPIL